MASASRSSWRSKRGEPQAAQRAVRGEASARQSRQKLVTAIPREECPRDYPPSGQIAFPVSTERAPRLGDARWIDPGAVGKRYQETLIAQHMVEHAGQKARFAGGLADILLRYAGDGKERPKPLRLFGEK